MKSESASNYVSCLYIFGLLILTAWGNAWVMVIFSVTGFPILFWFMPVEMRKPILKIALISGVIAAVAS